MGATDQSACLDYSFFNLRKGNSAYIYNIYMSADA